MIDAQAERYRIYRSLSRIDRQDVPALQAAAAKVDAALSRRCEAAETAEALQRLTAAFTATGNRPRAWDAFLAMIADTLGDYPAAVVKRVCHHKGPLIRKRRFAPTIADVAEACDAEKTQLLKRRAMARKMAEAAAQPQPARCDHDKYSAKERAHAIQVIMRHSRICEKCNRDPDHRAQWRGQGEKRMIEIMEAHIAEAEAAERKAAERKAAA